jgi:hypothetical protein
VNTFVVEGPAKPSFRHPAKLYQYRGNRCVLVVELRSEGTLAMEISASESRGFVRVNTHPENAIRPEGL